MAARSLLLCVFLSFCVSLCLALTCDVKVEPRGWPVASASGLVYRRGHELGSPTLQQAVETIRNKRATGNLAADEWQTICLGPGVHALSSPLLLTDEDHHVAFEGLSDEVGGAATPSAVISGGFQVTGFEPCGSDGLWCADVSSVASLLQSRHLYINGRRGVRALASSDTMAFFKGSGVSVDVDKYVVDASSGLDAAWANANTVEFRWTTPAASPWTESRCTALNVTKPPNDPQHLYVYMKNPCFTMVQQKPCGQGTQLPTSIENTGVKDVLATGPNSWYYDVKAATVWFYPTLADDLASTEVIAPYLETLLSANDSAFLSFQGISFEHATWLRPNMPLGYVEQQSGALVEDLSAGCDDTAWRPMPSNLMFSHTTSVSFSSCIFQHLGAGAVTFTGGAHGNLVEGCTFTDISGTAVQIGAYDTMKITDPALQEQNNTVANSLISGVAAEYRGCCGVQVGYSLGTTLTHLEVRDLTYGGLSIGWGWSRQPVSYASYNEVSYNRIHDFKLLLGDGGAIYALGPQASSSMHHNWVYNMGSGRGGGAYYPDEGSAYWDIGYNVFSNASFCSDDCEYLHIWISTIHDIHVHDTWTDTLTNEENGTNCTVTNTVLVQKGQEWPQQAKDIMANSGLLPAFGRRQPPVMSQA